MQPRLKPQAGYHVYRNWSLSTQSFGKLTLIWN